MWHGYQVLPVPPGFGWWFLALVVWSLIWKGIALWKAARNTHKVWFVVLLIVNTVGILEIIYIYFVAKKLAKTPPAVMPGQIM